MPWRLSDDLRRFKEITIGDPKEHGENVVLMGRKTWDSLPPARRPLPNRKNVVLTRQTNFSVPESVLTFAHLDQALASLKSESQCFVIGGGEIYAQALEHPDCKLLYVTEVEGDFDCDVIFPAYEHLFSQKETSQPLQEGSLNFQYKLFARN